MGPRDGAGLTVRLGTDLDLLAEDLLARLRVPALGVLEPEVVVVPTPGIGRWLEDRLSRSLGASGRDDGIAANLETILSGTLLRRMTGVAPGAPDPWSLGASTVACLAELARAEDPVLVELRDGLRGGIFPAARAAADLFDQLFLWRPDVAEEWLAGRASDPRAGLLRAVADRVGVEPPHRALDATLARLASGDDGGVALPARVSVFGGDALPGGLRFVRALDALADTRDVSVHLVVPATGRFETLRRAAPRWTGRPPERAAPESDPRVHPLLATWGAASADTAALLAQLPERPSTTVSLVEAARAAPTSVLSALQAAIRGDEVQRAAPDLSMTLHGCVGERRQVEAARDAILHAMTEDASLEPDDVAILCPELSRFATALEAVLGDPQGAPAIPYVLRDRAVSRSVPLVAAMAAALSLLGSRFARSAVVDLARRPACARRFALAEEDLDRVTEWAEEAEVRWGLGGETRAASGLPATFDAGTWRRALDRLLAGIALPGGLGSPVLALRAINPGHDLERVGALCDLVAALERLDAEAGAPRDLSAWCEFAREVLDALFAPQRDEARELESLQGLLGGIEDDAAGVLAPFEFAEFRSMFLDRASQVRDLVVSGPGGATVTSLAPLRNVPFRVVVLLGLDESALERARGVDLAFGEPRVGDRDPRAELRAALLATVLSTTDRLIVTHDARDRVTNVELPEAAALAELREAVVAASTGGAEAFWFGHPRHSHGDADLAPDARLGDRAFTFDRDALARSALLGADALPARDLRLATSAPKDAGADAGTEVSLTALSGFLCAPQREFLHRTLGARMPDLSSRTDDELATELDGLARWHAVDELVRAGLLTRAFDAEAFEAMAQEWRRAPDHAVSALPGVLSERALLGDGGVLARARTLLGKVGDAYAGRLISEVRTLIELDGATLSGAVRVTGDDTVVRWTASRDGFKVRVRTRVELLALTAQYPETEWRGVCVHLDGKRAVQVKLSVRGETPEERAEGAVESLRAIVALWRKGMREPLPLLAGATSRIRDALQREVTGPQDLLVRAGAAWSPFGGGGDGDAPEVVFCFGSSFERLAARPVLAGDPVAGHDAGGSRVLAYSLAALVALQELDAHGAGT